LADICHDATDAIHAKISDQSDHHQDDELHDNGEGQPRIDFLTAHDCLTSN